jgi:hypothetical protein
LLALQTQPFGGTNGRYLRFRVSVLEG